MRGRSTLGEERRRRRPATWYAVATSSDVLIPTAGGRLQREPPSATAGGRRVPGLARCGATSAAASSPYASASRCEELAAGEGVLLGADLLHDVRREHAADLGRALVAEVPARARPGSRPGRRRRRRSARPCAISGTAGDLDRTPRPSRSIRTPVGAERDDLGADPVEAPRRPTSRSSGSIRCDSYSLENRIRRAVDQLADQLAVAEGQLLARVGDERGSRAGGTPRCAAACPRGRRGRSGRTSGSPTRSTIGASSISPGLAHRAGVERRELRHRASRWCTRSGRCAGSRRCARESQSTPCRSSQER